MCVCVYIYTSTYEASPAERPPLRPLQCGDCQTNHIAILVPIHIYR